MQLGQLFKGKDPHSTQTLLFNLQWWQLPPRGKWLWITKLLCPNYHWNIFRLGEKLTFLLPMLGAGSGLTGAAYISRENKMKYCVVPRWERGKQIFHQVVWLCSWCELAQFHWFHLAIPNVYTFSSFEDRRTHSSGVCGNPSGFQRSVVQGPKEADSRTSLGLWQKITSLCQERDWRPGRSESETADPSSVFPESLSKILWEKLGLLSWFFYSSL